MFKTDNRFVVGEWMVTSRAAKREFNDAVMSSWMNGNAYDEIMSFGRVKRSMDGFEKRSLRSR